MIGAYSTQFMRTYFAVTVVVRELLEPYLVRSPEARRTWWSIVAAKEALLLGFGIPVYTLLSVPLLGPLTWIVA